MDKLGQVKSSPLRPPSSKMICGKAHLLVPPSKNLLFPGGLTLDQDQRKANQPVLRPRWPRTGLATDPVYLVSMSEPVLPELSSVSKSDPVWPRTQLCLRARPSCPRAGFQKQPDRKCTGPDRKCAWPTAPGGAWELSSEGGSAPPARPEAAAPGVPQVLCLVAHGSGSHCRPISVPSSDASTFKR